MHHCACRSRALERGVDALLPRGGAARRAQAAHAEEALDQPVVLEHLDAPRDALVEQPLVQLGVLRMRAVGVDPHRELVEVRRLRRQVPAVRDQRPPAEPLAQRARRRRATRRRAAPSATMPVGGTTHSSVSNGRSTSCGYHHESSCTAPTGRPRASRSSTAATTVDAASRPGSVRYQYALPLSVQYERRVPSTSASRAGARDARRRAQQSRPAREAVARAVAGDDRELGREAGVHVVDVAVPPRAQAVARPARGPPGTAITCSWNAVQRREQHRAPVGRDHPERQHDRRPDRQQPPARHRRVAEHRQRELGVLVPERAHSVGRAAVDAVRSDRSATRPRASRTRRSPNPLSPRGPRAAARRPARPRAPDVAATQSGRS